jgi:hypothetical protein
VEELKENDEDGNADCGLYMSVFMFILDRNKRVRTSIARLRR